MASSSLDPRRLERILSPWLTGGGGSAVAVEDAAGSFIAGSFIAGRVDAGDAGDLDARITAEILVGGEVVGRVVVTGADRAAVNLTAPIQALALAIGELETETLAHDGALRALVDSRSVSAAEALGTDANELAKGRQQQRSLVSLVAPEVQGYDLASQYAPARQIGGDFFELFRLDRRGHPLAIVIADVTGKGLDAALLMAFSRPVMHSALQASHGPAEALARTNRVLVGERRGTLFITAACAMLEPRSGRIRIATAGHEPALLIPGDGGPVTEFGNPGVLIGAFPDLAIDEVETTLRPGDALLFYTDGVTDAVDPTGQRFGDDRLLATLESARGGSAHELVAAVRDAVTAFVAHAEPADDVTIVAIGRHHRGRSVREGSGP